MVMWLDSWNMNLSRIRNSLLYHPKRDIHNTWITQARVPTSTLKYPNWPRAENSFGSWHCLQSCMAMAPLPWAWGGHGWWNLEDFIQNWHRANLGSPSFTTHSLYLSCTSHSSRNLQSSWARGMTHHTHASCIWSPYKKKHIELRSGWTSAEKGH